MVDWDKAMRVADAVTRQAAREGRLVEAGWEACKANLGPLSPEEEDRLKRAYYGGAQHVWHGMMGVLDAGEEPTDSDLSVFEGIEREMRAWYEEQRALLERKHDKGGQNDG